MNRSFQYPDADQHYNQIWALNKASFFSNINLDIASLPALPVFDGIAQNAEELTRQAKTYLQVNCAMCHHPAGPAPGNIDFRYETPFMQMNLCNVNPQFSDLGIPNAKLIAPGNLEKSVLLRRISENGEHRMPPLASHMIDVDAVELVRAWIEELKSCE